MKEGRLLPAYATQRKVAARFPGDDERQTRLREGLMALLDDVLFIEDPRRKGYFVRNPCGNAASGVPPDTSTGAPDPRDPRGSPGPLCSRTIGE